MVENESFRSYLRYVMMAAEVLDRRPLLIEMRRIRTELEPKLAASGQGQHGGWTVISTTYTVINEG